MLTRLRLYALVYAFYLLIAILITWPLVTVLSTRIAGFGYSDAYEMAHHIWWFKYAIQHGEPLFVQTYLGYPGGIDGITLWANPLQFFPAWLLAFVLPLAAAYNIVLLLTLALNGLGMYRLALHLTGQHAPALLAGLVFMAYPTMQGHLGASHGGLMVQWPLPLYLYALLRLRETHQPRWIAVGALLFVLSAWGHTLQVIYALMPVTIAYGLLLIVRREWRTLALTALTGLVGALGLIVYQIPVAQATFGTSSYADEGGTVRYSADLLGIFTPSFFHPLFGELTYTHRVLGINLDEGAAYIGIIVLILSAIAAWKMPASRWWLGLAALAYVLSLGPLLKIFDQPVTIGVTGEYETYIPLPWAIFTDLPVFNLARTPGRFSFALALSAAALAAYGAAYLWARFGTRSLRWGVLIASMVVILFEYQLFWAGWTPQLPTVPADIPPAIAQLAERDDLRAVFNAPWNNLVAAKEALYLQTGHEHPLIAGQVTRRTPVSPAKLSLLETTFDPALLSEAGADIVIIHREHDPNGTLQNHAQERLGEALYSDTRFAVFAVPAPDDEAKFAWLTPDLGTITNRVEAYLYASETAWAQFRMTLQAEGRTVIGWLNGDEMGRWNIDGEQAFTLSLPLTEPGYHTVTLGLESACPQTNNPALMCRAVELQQISLGEFELMTQPLAETVRFEGGLQLAAADLPVTAAAGESLPVRLWWQFEQPRDENDIRFVHVVDSAGVLAGQVDNNPGVFAADTGLLETVNVSLRADLPPGEYRVFTGWYRYPEIDRFCVLANGQCGNEDAVLLGTLVIP